MELENLSHYRILERIGSGGMGDVYLAEDTRLKRRVAIKILTSKFARDPVKISRFEHEARAASALNHPNILTVYDFGSIDSVHYIITEYAAGKTLREHLRYGALPLREVRNIVLDIAKALSVAHEAGIVHRDIKPENIMIRNDGYVKILDFGLAKIVETKFRENPLVITEPGQILGTPKYMSPEQIRGLAVDARSDIFSLGVVLYEMLTGLLPFDGATVGDVIASVLRNEPLPARELVPDLPVQVDQILDRALQKDPDDRYRTMRRFLYDLQGLPDVHEAAPPDENETLELNAAPTALQQDAADTNPPVLAQTSEIVEPQSLTRHPALVAFILALVVLTFLVGALLYFDPVILPFNWGLGRYDLTIEHAPPRSQIFIDGYPSAVTHDDGYLLLQNVPGGRHGISFQHPYYECEAGVIVLGQKDSPNEYTPRCKPNAWSGCDNIRPHEEDKAEQCFILALFDLPDPFTTKDLVTALNNLVIDFDDGSYEVPYKRLTDLQTAAFYIKKLPPNIVLEIGGHTDNVGNADSLRSLSEQRAEAVKNKLVEFGVPQPNLLTRGYGATRPKDDNSTELGRFHNRRIEFSIVNTSP